VAAPVQQHAAPPESWAPRTDAGARKLVQRVDDLRGDLKAYVTHRELLAWALSAAVVLVGGAWVVVRDGVQRADDAATRAAVAAKSETARTEADLERHEKAHRAELEAIRQELLDGREDIKGLYRYLLSGKRQARLEAREGPP
jgi:hypothetical protein